MTLKALGSDNRNAVSVTLILVWALAVWHFRIINSVIYPLLAITSITSFDLALTWLKSKKLYWPFSSLVTGLLIGLILPLTVPYYVIITAAFLSSISKQFLGSGIRRHVFNPAAFGIMAVNLIFGAGVAWWAVSWSLWPLVILIPFMARILWRLKRIFLPIGFLAASFLYLLTIRSPQLAAQTLFDGTVLLFALVMLTEIITSPASGFFKYWFGVIVAFVSVLISPLNIFADAYLPALLMVNLGTFIYLRWKSLNKVATSTASGGNGNTG